MANSRRQKKKETKKRSRTKGEKKKNVLDTLSLEKMEGGWDSLMVFAGRMGDK